VSLSLLSFPSFPSPPPSPPFVPSLLLRSSLIHTRLRIFTSTQRTTFTTTTLSQSRIYPLPEPLHPSLNAHPTHHLSRSRALGMADDSFPSHDSSEGNQSVWSSRAEGGILGSDSWNGTEIKDGRRRRSWSVHSSLSSFVSSLRESSLVPFPFFDDTA